MVASSTRGLRTPALISPEGIHILFPSCTAVVVTGTGNGIDPPACHLSVFVSYSRISLLNPGCCACSRFFFCVSNRFFPGSRS